MIKEFNLMHPNYRSKEPSMKISDPKKESFKILGSIGSRHKSKIESSVSNSGRTSSKVSKNTFTKLRQITTKNDLSIDSIAKLGN